MLLQQNMNELGVQQQKHKKKKKKADKNKNKKSIVYRFYSNIKEYYQLYLLLLPTLIYFLVFHYGPMYGAQIAFKDFNPVDGIWSSAWVGFEHFIRFFNSFKFWLVLKNTLGLSLYSLVVGFPAPIILALLLNQMPSKKYKKMIQTVTYAPHFISTVVIVGMLYIFLSPRIGLINHFLNSMGMKSIFFMGDPDKFKSLFVFSGIWQHAGWSSIIYLAALAGINPSLHEAAIVDGANKFQRIWYIDLPGLVPTIIILLILRVGRIMRLNFQKALLMQNPMNINAAEVIQTYVYKMGLLNAQFDFATAVGIFNSVISLILLLTVNRLAKKISDTGLF